MPRIARGEENTPTKINWFTRVSGVLTTMYSMEFRIFRIEDGLPGVQVFPLAGWEDVSAPPGRYADGYYWAYDNANAKGWTPDVMADIGTHRIFWRWKQYATSSYQEGAEDFELVAAEGGVADTYIVIADVRNEGLANPPYTDTMIDSAIITWQQFLDRACNQWFLPKELTIEFDGDGSFTAHFGVPIISVEYLRINRSTSDLDPNLYKVYNDDDNPKIALVQPGQLRDIHQPPFGWSGEMRFLKGYKNQVVKGTFGRVDEIGDPPALIKRALLKLVIEKLTRPIYGEGSGDASPMTFAGIVIEEKTDGHSVKYGTAKFQDRRVGLSGITQDAEILDIIRLYKAPIGFATTSYWSYL